MTARKHRELDVALNERIDDLLGRDFDSLEPAMKVDVIKTGISWWKAQAAAKADEYGSGLADLLKSKDDEEGPDPYGGTRP